MSAFSARSPYKEYRFLVTGGAGFIGSHLVDRLLAEGAGRVRVLDDLSHGRWSNLQGHMGDSRFELIIGSITDPAVCERACLGITHLAHQAALGSVPRSWAEPERFSAVNNQGFANLLASARRANIRRVVFASSSSVYGDHPALPKQEHQTGNALSPYALTKQLNERQAARWAAAYGLETVGLRYFNVFGPRQRPDGPYAALIPRLLAAARQNQPPTLFGDGEQTRDFTFVANVVEANWLALTTPRPGVAGQVFNVATGRQLSLNAVWEQIQVLTGCTRAPLYEPGRPGDITHSVASVSKIQRLLGYRPAIGFEEGLRYTLETTSAAQTVG